MQAVTNLLHLNYFFASMQHLIAIHDFLVTVLFILNICFPLRRRFVLFVLVKGACLESHCEYHLRQIELHIETL